MKRLFLFLSFSGLVGISAVSYGWTYYAKNSRQIPRASCLEMMCQYGCVEDDKGAGYCCGAGQVGDKCYGSFCCQNGLICSGKTGTSVCTGCSKNSDCPDLHTFCSNGRCVPCNQEGTGLRLSADAEHCSCPTGYTKRCGTTSTSVSCLDGGRWTCVRGCFDHTDCQTDYYCSCNGNSCPAAGGQCQPCPTGTHRDATSATGCLPCAECQVWDEATRSCISTCPEGQVCIQNPGTGFPPDYERCNGDTCLAVPAKNSLVHVKGTINKRDFYFPPANALYQMTHTSASRFCEHYGLHLATVNEACVKDYAYDSGYDCPNFVNNQTFSDRGMSYRLSSWHVESSGSFWLANLSGYTALRVTYSCGNNHSSVVCNRFYPLCTTN